MSKFDPEKLKALQQRKTAKIGGQRVKKPIPSSNKETASDRKVVNAVQKLGGRPLQVTELNFFSASSPQVTQFTKPKAVVAPQSNTWLFTGKGVTRPIAEALPGIMNHLGIENIAALRDAFGAPGDIPTEAAGGADDVPNFDEVEDEEAPELVE